MDQEKEKVKGAPIRPGIGIKDNQQGEPQTPPQPTPNLNPITREDIKDLINAISLFSDSMKKVVSNNIGLPVVSLPAAVQDNNIINPLTTFDDPFKVLDFLLSRTVEQIAAISEDVKEEDEQNSTFLNIFYDGVEHTKQRLEIIAKAYIDLTFTKNGR